MKTVNYPGARRGHDGLSFEFAHTVRKVGTTVVLRAPGQNYSPAQRGDALSGWTKFQPRAMSRAMPFTHASRRYSMTLLSENYAPAIPPAPKVRVNLYAHIQLVSNSLYALPKKKKKIRQ